MIFHLHVSHGWPRENILGEKYTKITNQTLEWTQYSRFLYYIASKDRDQPDVRSKFQLHCQSSTGAIQEKAGTFLSTPKAMVMPTIMPMSTPAGRAFPFHTSSR